MKYRREIDGLRAVAILPVIFFHAGFKAFEGGFVGVDVFFVVSGYLITTIILSDMNKEKFSIVTFYERRARRILPALFFVMLCCFPLAWVWLTPQHLKGFSQSLTAVSLFYSNILFWQQSGYFDVVSELKPLLHTWSLAVEEQYYVFFPLFLMALWRLRKRWIFGSLAIVCISSLMLSQWGAYHEPLQAFYLLPTRLWELAIGAMIAFYFLYKRDHLEIIISRRKICEFFGLIGLFLIVYSIFTFDKSTPFPSFYALIPTIGTGLIIVYSNEKTLVGQFLSTRVMVGVGLISYSTYLWHQPLFSFARHRSFSEPTVFTLLFLSLLSILLAYISWRYVESPFRDKKIVSRKFIFTFAVGGSFLFASIGLCGHFTDGFYELKVTDLKKNMLATAAPSPMREKCHSSKKNYIKPQDSCVYQVENISWATFGDSHAVELAYALSEHLRELEVGLKHFSFSSCQPSYGNPNPNPESPCAEWTNESIDYIVNNKNIKNVAVSYRINAYLSSGKISNYPKSPVLKDREILESLIQSYVNLTDRLIDSGKTVYLVVQAPELPVDIERIVFMDFLNSKEIKGVNRSWWEDRNKYFMSQLNRFNSKIKIINPSEFLCDNNHCYATRNGDSMYFDDDHLSVAGASKVVDMIFAASDKDF